MPKAVHAVSHEVMAPAKINLYLRVLGRRPDGYHELDSVLQMVGLCDTLRFEERPSGIVMTATGETMPTGDENLIMLAAKLLQARQAKRRGIHIHVTKQIPLASGLGGASSDAAAVLFMLNRIWKLGLTTRALAALGARLGSDVPFFFYGPVARVGGRGTQVTALSLVGSRWLVLVNPGLAVSTGSVYRALNAGPGIIRFGAGTLPGPRPGPGLGRDQATTWTVMTRMLHNDLETVTARRHPVIRAIKAALMAAGATGALMSGSGSTVFGLFRDQIGARQAATEVGGHRGWRVWVAPTLRISPLAP